MRLRGRFVLAVRTVAQGGYWFSPPAVKGLIESPADTARSSNRKLTGREREILILVTQGMSNEQIAEKLEPSQTVRNYISRIYSWRPFAHGGGDLGQEGLRSS